MAKHGRNDSGSDHDSDDGGQSSTTTQRRRVKAKPTSTSMRVDGPIGKSPPAPAPTVLPSTGKAATATATATVNKRQKLPTVTTAPMAPPGTLLARPHGLIGRAVVKMKPVLRMIAGRIEQLVISAQQRTPSPFSKGAGDHTVAWAAVVDALRARLTDLTLPAAVDELTRLHDEATAWMTQPGSAGMQLLDALPDRDNRAVLLENAAWLTGSYLAQAEAASTDQDRAIALQNAVAQHLTYLNYLPFATVPAERERGSTGSGEGARRRRILAVEAESLPGGVATDRGPDQRTALSEDLWGLFDIDAALRASGARVAIDPDAAEEIQRALDAVHQLRDGLAAATDLMRTDGETLPLTGVKKQAMAVIADKGNPAAMIQAALAVKAAVESILDNAMESNSVRNGVINRHRALVGAAVAEAEQAAQFLQDRVPELIPRAGLILAHLLREHQRAMATAYPHAVAESDFLNDDPLLAAGLRLDSLLEIPDYDAHQDKLRQLLDVVLDKYGQFGPPPAAGDRNGWVRNAANTDLVVSYDPSHPTMLRINGQDAPQTLTVNGRAAAPSGVGGMGSHSTSWRAEVLALNALVAGKSEAAAMAALKKEILADLQSDVMALDQFLPADQLEAGQLVELFTAARQALAATTLADRATAYLRFRNLLPFATLDAGSRDGHGEATSDSAAVNFDRASLAEAVALQKTAFTEPEQLARMSQALLAAADDLGEEDWGAELTALMKSTTARLTGRAGRMGSPAAVGTAITKARTAEHNRVAELAGFAP